MTKLSKLIFVMTLGMGTLSAYPQNHVSAGAKESFQEFRRKLKEDYNSFRKRILEQYADFLEGEWHPYEPLTVNKKDDTPKPATQPRITDNPASTPSADSRQESVHPVRSSLPHTGETSGDRNKNRKPKSQDTPKHSPVYGREGEHRGISDDKADDFSFYGIPMQLEHVDFNILNNVSSPSDAASQWRKLQNENGTDVAKSIDALADEMGLNGYLTFRLAESFLRSRFPTSTESSIMSATHFLLANMGYDARLAITSTGVPLMLLPIEQTVYGSLYLSFDGRAFTAFPPEGVKPESLSGATIRTCKLPEMKDKGRPIDLKINGLRLPERKKSFVLEGGGIRLQGEINENLFEMLYRYPQMPTEDFAVSTLDPKLRADLVNQVRSQLGAMNQEKAVNTLLSFFHALPYATDEQRHGFEKPYFLEETLYYDKCDCEDRAIMFTWLLWNALGIPNHLIAYPGHESAAVKLHDRPARDSGYSWGNATYWSADPTYIGASVGDIMPSFTTTTPHIDLSYE